MPTKRANDWLGRPPTAACCTKFIILNPRCIILNTKFIIFTYLGLEQVYVPRLGVVLIDIRRDPPEVAKQPDTKTVEGGQPEERVGVTLEHEMMDAGPAAEEPEKPCPALLYTTKTVSHTHSET